MLSEAAFLVRKSVLSSITEKYSVAYERTMGGALIIHIASKQIAPTPIPDEGSSYAEACAKAGVKRLIFPLPSSFCPSYEIPKELQNKKFSKGVELFFPLKLKKLDALMKGFSDEERIELLSELCYFFGAKELCSLPSFPQKS